jgi:hypothetical protein
VGQTLGRGGKGVVQSAQLLGQSARVCGGSAQALVAMRLHEEENPELVEKVSGGCSTHVIEPPRGGVRRPGGAQGGADEAGGGSVRAGIAKALGGGGAALVGPFGTSASMTMELAWGWKVEEAPMAQLLGCSRRSGTARSGRRRLSSRTRRAEERGGHEESKM